MFLVTNKVEMKERGFKELDFVIVTGDAYVDHHSFGTAIIGRLLERNGYKVGVIPQPDYKDVDAFRALGKPRLAFLVNSGTVDSMVNNYSVFKRKRRVDEYSPGGEKGRRPDRALIVYCNVLRQAYKDVPIIIGGIEASLRRFGHYDYWSNKVRRSILLDSKADILMYGMGEKTVIQLAEALEGGIEARDITWIPGTVVKTKELLDPETVLLPSYSEIVEDKEAYCKSFVMQYENNDALNGVPLAEDYGDFFVVQNLPQLPLEPDELDYIYELPFENEWHPMYDKEGGIPAFKEIKFSIVSCRGCFGGCSFCAITYHQGRQVRGRSKESIVNEAKKLTKNPDFKGYINDVGGPTANFRKPSCKGQLKHGMCKRKQCLFPKPCKHLDIDHEDYLDVLKAVREIPEIKKVFIRSGIRYDYLMVDDYRHFMNELCQYHVSGTLKVAPEHVCDNVLRYMGKPKVEVFDKFTNVYEETNKRLKKKQYLIPYLISSHPGSTLDDAVDMAIYLKGRGFVPDQVQDFYPTPGTLATCMYYTEMDPFTMEKIHVAKDLEEKKMQRALIHFNKAENRDEVVKALKLTGRTDVMGVLFPGSYNGGNRLEHTGKSRKNHRGRSKGVGKYKGRQVR